jgi:hypothetical protein
MVSGGSVYSVRWGQPVRTADLRPALHPDVRVVAVAQRSAGLVILDYCESAPHAFVIVAIPLFAYNDVSLPKFAVTRASLWSDEVHNAFAD